MSDKKSSGAAKLAKQANMKKARDKLAEMVKKAKDLEQKEKDSLKQIVPSGSSTQKELSDDDCSDNTDSNDESDHDDASDGSDDTDGSDSSERVGPSVGTQRKEPRKVRTCARTTRTEPSSLNRMEHRERKPQRLTKAQMKRIAEQVYIEQFKNQTQLQSLEQTKHNLNNAMRKVQLQL